MNRLALLRRRVRRTVLARRRLLAALAAGTAVAAGLQAAAAPPPPTTTVLTAARDLPGGTVVRASDLVRTEFTPASVPAGAVTAAAALGRTTAAPVRAGEPLTDVRLVSGSLLDGYPGRVAAPVRIGDSGAVDLLRIGDRVDVVAADPQGRAPATVVAYDAPVVALPRGGDDGAALTTGGLLVLAVSEETAAELAGAGVSRYLSVLIRH
jgi:Flp pilus assembly protein CpaB